MKHSLIAMNHFKTYFFSYLMSIITLITACGGRAQAANGYNSFPKDTFYTESGRRVVITFIKHASLMISCDQFNLYIDPVSSYADYTSFPPAKLLLITHEHGDHLDKQAIAQLTKENTLIVANESSAQKIPHCSVLKWHQKMILSTDPSNMTPSFTILPASSKIAHETNKLVIEAVPAYNITPEHAAFHPRLRDNGYVLEYEGLRIYVAGDTENIPEMSALKAIDIAFLPVNQPYTMTVKQAVDAAKVIKPKILYPYHYHGTPIDELSKALHHSGIEVRIRHME
jgi:L-ascorbate metabolism protein UlaG (beta-lactamase superfamily)